MSEFQTIYNLFDINIYNVFDVNIQSTIAVFELSLTYIWIDKKDLILSKFSQ